MNEEERSNLYIYTYSDLDDDFIFAETIYTLGDLHKLQQENKQLKNTINKTKKEIEKHLNAKSYSNHKYELFSREYLEELLDLLKEIK